MAQTQLEAIIWKHIFFSPKYVTDFHPEAIFYMEK